jgi:hypothetical protein
MSTTLDSSAGAIASQARGTRRSKQSDAVKNSPSNRRADRRLEVHLPVEISRAGEESVWVRATTRNISTGGVYFELERAGIEEGDDLRLQVTIPPMEGVSPYTGRAECMARVLRVRRMGSQDDGIQRFGIAAKFLDRLQFSY